MSVPLPPALKLVQHYKITGWNLRNLKSTENVIGFYFSRMLVSRTQLFKQRPHREGDVRDNFLLCPIIE